MKKLKFILIFLVLILIVGYFALDYYGSNTANIEVANIDFSKIPDGVYDGEYKIPPVSVITKSTIKDGIITEIELVDHYNGLGQEGEKIIPKIIASQSLKVDVISGATASSMTIIKSVEQSMEGKEIE